MSFLKSLKKLSLGGLVAQKLTGSKENQGGFLLGLMDPKYDKPIDNKFDPGARPGASINGQSGVDQPPQRLGWTNNGRQYANSPFNNANPSYYSPPPAGGPPGGGSGVPPMSFGPGSSAMTASGPQGMQMGGMTGLQPPPGPGTFQGAGAPPPTGADPRIGMIRGAMPPGMIR